MHACMHVNTHRLTLLCRAPHCCTPSLLLQQLGPLWPADPWPTKHNPALHDPYKTAAMAAVGAGVAAPVSLLLYRAMDLAAPGTAPLLVAAKFTVEQVVGCVLWQAAYCALHDRYRATLLDWLATKHNAGRRNVAARVGSPAVSRVSTPAC